jgi:hypothetical protein
MTKLGLIQSLVMEHKNQKQEHKVCKNKFKHNFIMKMWK